LLITHSHIQVAFLPSHVGCNEHYERSHSYRAFQCHIIPNWGAQAITNIKPLEVERKINSLPVSKKTKSHIMSPNAPPLYWIARRRTKTPDSEDKTALDPDVLALLLRWKEECSYSSEQWLSKCGYRQAIPRRVFERRSSASCRADDSYPESRLVRLQPHLLDDLGRRGGSDWRATETDASFRRQNDHESLLYCV
jgi:hypothetical protein